MKVLLVLEATLGGTSRHIIDLASGLLARNLEVHLVYSLLRADEGFVTGLAWLSKTYPEFHHHAIPIKRELSVSDFGCYLKLRRYIRDHGPFDVIHAHSTKAGFLTRLQLVSGTTRVVYTPHGLMTLNPKLKGFRRGAVCALESILARWTDTVIAVSSVELDCAIETGIARSTLTVIPNGIQPVSREVQREQREKVRASLGLSDDTVCIGFVGRLVEYKEPQRVIQAFSALKRLTNRRVRLALIGWGPMQPELEKQVAGMGLSKDVLFLGQVDGRKHMPAFDVLIQATRFEAFSYVLVEALSAGLPAVTTRVGAANDLVTEGITGYICDPWDAGTGAARLQMLVDDPDRRFIMSEAAREVASQYSVANMIDSVAGLYQRLCSQVQPEAIRRIHYQDSPGNLP
jgi:glycosyltransferase involved in cell wall biosynthesis